jgi:hypothetical protein
MDRRRIALEGDVMTMLRALILFTAVAVAGPAAAEGELQTTFLGWSEDGTYHVERVQNESLKQLRGKDFVSIPYYLFVPTRPDVKPTWPARIAKYPKRDEPYAIVQPEALGADDAAALAAVRALVKAPPPAKTGPAGMALAVETRDDDAIHVITAGDRVLPMRPVSEGYTIEETYWRADGGAVAFVAEYGGGDKMRRGNRIVFAYDLTRYLVPGGDRKAATALRKAATRLAKAKDWEAALVELQEAVNVDPTFVPAQYELAAAAARRGELLTLKRALAALGASKDPAAAAARAKVAGDPAFARALASDDVRALIGLPAFAALTPEQRLTGTWTFEGRYCDESWLTLTLAKKGKATLRVRNACTPEHAREWDRKRTFTGTWAPSATGADVRLKLRPNADVPDLRTATAAVRPCPEGWCLFVDAAAGKAHGPFHRGDPQ